MIKKADIVLFFVLLAVGLTISWASLNSGQTGDKVRISVGGETYGVYDLAQDRTIQVRQWLLQIVPTRCASIQAPFIWQEIQSYACLTV